MVQMKTFRIKYLLFSHFMYHLPPNLFSTWNRVSENMVNALNVVSFAHLCVFPATKWGFSTFRYLLFANKYRGKNTL
jgi:hypothetical protein